MTTVEYKEDLERKLIYLHKLYDYAIKMTLEYRQEHNNAYPPLAVKFGNKYYDLPKEYTPIGPVAFMESYLENLLTQKEYVQQKLITLKKQAA